MNTNKRVSYTALRALTYTILCRAVIDAVMLISCMLEVNTVFVVAQTAGFINIVACVVSFVGIIALSDKFVFSHRIMVLVLLIECAGTLLITIHLSFTMDDYEAALAAVDTITLVSSVAERLLVGVAFLFLMNGFGEILNGMGKSNHAAAAGRFGAIYLFFCAVGAMFIVFAERSDVIIFTYAGAVFETIRVVLEFLLYLRVSEMAFLLWRNHSFHDLDEGIQKA